MTLYDMSMQSTRAREGITVRLDPEKRHRLDALAQALDRDRSYVVNEAIDAYLAVHDWQILHVAEGLRQAHADAFATEAEIDAAFDRWK
jgi:predicted transcriptional regulator